MCIRDSLDPLGEILLRKAHRPNYPRYIYLLTDGDVNNTAQVVSLVANNSKGTRISALGIGTGASPALVKGVAEAGNGIADFVTDNEDIAEKVISMMVRSTLPLIDCVKLDIDRSLLELAHPNEGQQRFVSIGDIYSVFLYLNESFDHKDGFECTLSYTDPVNKQSRNIPINIRKVDAVTTDSVSRLGAHRIVQTLETQANIAKEGYSNDPDVYVAIKTEKESLIEEISLRFKVLSDKTSFILVSDQKVRKEDKLEEEREVSIQIPNLKSIDHYGLSQRSYATQNRLVVSHFGKPSSGKCLSIFAAKKASYKSKNQSPIGRKRRLNPDEESEGVECDNNFDESDNDEDEEENEESEILENVAEDGDDEDDRKSRSRSPSLDRASLKANLIETLIQTVRMDGSWEYNQAILKKLSLDEKIQHLTVRYSSNILMTICILLWLCLLYTSPSPRDRQKSRMPSSA
eukprot:TRINITY_DN4263_c0_g1_i1.p1 TRINITY_DN4263_c0_g1~~TRINITY_DN4263_c0_g1_i1.p1  ORF type:complete len:461 (+),score=88.24 TRINITY_DN4263_c0_g1_i1:64-1446(+)